MPRVSGTLETRVKVVRKLLWASLLLIFFASVIASKIDSWYAVIGGAILAALGCYLNQKSIKLITAVWPDSSPK